MYDEELDSLEDGLRRLKIEYDIFFNGHRKKPPDDLRMRVERISKKLSEVQLTAAQRFRYNTLVNRFYVLRDLWRRTLQKREMTAEGETRGERRMGIEEAARQRAAKERSAGELRVSISNPAAEEEKIRQLYAVMVDLRGKSSKEMPSVSYEQFARYVVSQTKKIQSQSGCTRVAFAISVEEDSIRFTARAEQQGT